MMAQGTRSYTLTLAIALTVVASASSQLTHAQNGCVISEADFVATEVEACVQILREEPSGASYSEAPTGMADALGAGYAPAPVTVFTAVNVGDKDFSIAFNECIRRADPGYKSLASTTVDSSSMDLPVIDGERKTPARYRYTNKYQVHELRDLERKRVYKLIRVSREGSIEALGTWQGPNSPSTYADHECKNSNGDPCGTRYLRNRAGSYEKL